MTLISQSVDNFLGGVSQQDERFRDASQASEQINCLTDPSNGLMKRPGTKHKSVISLVIGDYVANDVFVQEITRDADERYLLVIRNGDLKVVKPETGAEMTLYTPEGVSYLTAGQSFRAYTLGNTTFVLNKDKVVAKLTDEAAERAPEALVFVRSVDFNTAFHLTVGSYEALHITPASNNVEARGQLDTAEVTRSLHNLLLNQAGFTVDFESERMGSTIYIRAQNGKDFDLRVRDGLADKGLLAVKNSVQRFEDLPLRAKDGFICQVLGDPGTEYDDHWVVFDESNNPDESGVWRETVQPGTPTKLDPATMPHELILKGAFTDQGLSRGAAADPIIKPARFAEDTFGWDNVVSEGAPEEPIVGDDGPIISDQDDEVNVDIGDIPGEPVEIELAFNADTTFVDPHVRTRLIVEHDDGGGYVGVYDRDISSGENLRGIVAPIEITPTVSSKLRTRVEYSTGATPEPGRKARIVIPRPPPPIIGQPDAGDILPPPIRRRVRYAKSVSFGPDRLYPGGFQLTLTLNATNFDYVPSSDETGTAVAIAFQALIDADAGFSSAVVNTGEIHVTAGDGTAAITVTHSTAFSELTHAWLRDLDLTGVDLVGAAVRNLTDGSVGTITSHTAGAVTVASMVGGLDNLFQKDDLLDIAQSGTYWVFRPAKWRSREVGSMETNPFPDFVGEKIADVSFYKNRLILVYKDAVHTSAAADLRNLFRITALQLRADDPIAATAAISKETIFHAALEWDQDFYLISEAGPVLLSGEPVLSPETVRLDLVGAFENTSSARPVVLGNSLILTHETPEGKVRVFEVFKRESDVLERRDITLHVPTFIEGTPVQMFGSHSQGILVLATRTAIGTPDTWAFWVYRFADEGNQRLVSSWSKWTFEDDIVAANTFGEELAFIRAGDDQVTFDAITVTDPPLSAVVGKARQMDRFVLSSETALSPSYLAGVTTFTLPYRAATDGSDGDMAVVRLDTGEVFSGASVTRPAVTTVAVDAGVDLTAVDVAVGVLFEQAFTPTPILYRTEGRPDTRGRLTMHFVDLHYHESTDFTATVSPAGKDSITYTLDVATPQDGTLRVKIQAKAYTLRITNVTPGACNLSSMDWEGSRVVRSGRA